VLAAARGEGSARGGGSAKKEDEPRAHRLEELIRSGEGTDVDDSSCESRDGGTASGELLRHLKMLDAGTAPADSSRLTHRLQDIRESVDGVMESVEMAMYRLESHLPDRSNVPQPVYRGWTPHLGRRVRRLMNSRPV